MENGHLQWIYPLKMVIFHSYVSLPEGMRNMVKFRISIAKNMKYGRKALTTARIIGKSWRNAGEMGK
jgi:hypothetical protein